jgi:hypothetical protein
MKSLELGNLIIENETHVDWENILGAFEFDYLLDQIPRLVRSQYWGDPDCFYRSEIIAWKPFSGNEEAIKKHGYNQGVNAMYSISHGSR